MIVITPKTMVRLTGNPAALCPHEWNTPTRRNPLGECHATRGAHLCVGDVHHRGKHVCPCGALAWVAEPTPPHISATVALPDGTALHVCACSPDFARNAALGVVTFTG